MKSLSRSLPKSNVGLGNICGQVTLLLVTICFLSILRYYMPPSRSRPKGKKRDGNKVICSLCGGVATTRYHERKHREEFARLQAQGSTSATQISPAALPAISFHQPIEDAGSDLDFSISDSDLDAAPSYNAEDPQYSSNTSTVISTAQDIDINNGYCPILWETLTLEESNALDEETSTLEELNGLDINFESLGIWDQWNHITQIHASLWMDPEDPEEDVEVVELEKGLEDEGNTGVLEDDEEDFFDYGSIDWDQYEFGKNGRLSASDQVRANWYSEYCDIGTCF
jgi:hypothetical protein